MIINTFMSTNYKTKNNFIFFIIIAIVNKLSFINYYRLAMLNCQKLSIAKIMLLFSLF